MNPAAVLSSLVKVEGLAPAIAQYQEFDKQGRKAAVGADKLSAAAATQGKTVQESSKHMRTATTAVIGFFGAVAGYKVIKDSVDATTQFMRSTQQLSRNFGLSTKAASEWGAVMQARGVDANRLTMSFKQFSTQVRNADSGSAKSVATFKTLGITQKELADHGNNLQYMLGLVSDGLDKLPPGTNKAAIQAQLFGRSWQTIAPLIRSGSDEMNKQLNVADKYGATIKGSASSVESMIARQREFKLAVLGLQLTLGQTLIPALSTVLGKFLEWIQAFRSAPSGLKIVAAAMLGVSAAIWAINIALHANPIVEFGIALVTVTVAVVEAYKESEKFRAVVDKIGVVLRTAGTAVYNFVSPIINALAPAVKSVIGFFGSLGSSSDQMRSSMTSAGSSVSSVWATVTNAVRTAWQGTIGWITTAWSNVSKALGPSITNVGIIFTSVFNMIKTVVGPVFTLLSVGFTGVLPVLRGFGNAFVSVGSTIASEVKIIGSLLGTVLVGAFKAAWGVIKSVVTAWWQAVKGAFDIMRGLLATFAGLFTLDFKKMWNGIKQVFSGALTMLTGLIRGAWGVFKAAGTFLMDGLKAGFSAVIGSIKNVVSGMISSVLGVIKGAWNAIFNAGKYLIGGVASGFKAALNAVLGTITGFLNDIIDVLNKVPFVHIGHIKAPHFAQGGVQTAATGQKVTRPGYFAGEEAPQHPEYILATNPAYRQRNLGLWAQAGNALGVPGFASGGTWFNVKASAESLGGTGYMGNPIQPYGYSELSIPPSSLNFAGLGRLPYKYPLNIQAGSRSTYATKQDVGAGSSFQPVMGLYPGTVNQLGLSGGEFTIKINDPKGLLHPMRTAGGGGGVFGAIGSILGAAFGGITGLVDMLPKPPKLPGWISGIGKFLIGGATKFIKDKIGGFFGGPGSKLGISSPGWTALDNLAAQMGLRVSSGYRPGSITSSGNLSYHAMGRAHDYADSATQMLNFAHAVAAQYGGGLKELIHTPLGWGIKNGARVPLSFWGPTVNSQHYNHVHVAFRKGGKYGGFGSGGMVTANRPTLALFGEAGPETAMFIPHYATGGIAEQISPAWGGIAEKISPAWVAPTADWRSALGIPGLPRVGGSAGRTAADANRIAGTVAGLRTTIGSLSHQLSTMDAVFSFSSEEFLDASGKRNEAAITKRVNELRKLAGVAKQIFDAYGRLVVWLQRLVTTYQNVIADLQSRKIFVSNIANTLQRTSDKISLKGLKGNALKSAQRHKSDAASAAAHWRSVASQFGTDITNYSGKLSDYSGQITTSMDDRDSSWLDWQRYLNEITSVSGTKATEVTSTGTDITGTNITGTGISQELLDAQTALATQAQQAYTVSQAQYSALANFVPVRMQGGMWPPYGGSFAEGGIVPGPTGAARTVIAHGGEAIGSNSPIQVQVIVLDGAVDSSKIQVIAQDAAMQVTRSQARSGMIGARMPGSRGGL